MSRQELADAVIAHLHEHVGRTFGMNAQHVAALERGKYRWPSAHYRAAFRAVLGRDTDAELGFYITRGHATDPSPVVSVAEAVAGVAVPDAAAGAVRVSVTAEAGTAVMVVCDDDAAGRVAVVAGGVRIQIDASGTGPASLVPAAGGARVYSLAERRAR